MTEKIIEIKGEKDVVTARQVGREFASKLGFGLADQTRLATAISELVRNVIQHAGQGVCLIADHSDKEMIKVRVVIEDNGPGIPDIAKTMEYGFSTDEGSGDGLPAAKRLVHEFHLESEPGCTKVTIAITRRRL